ncbi:hypothetical protein A0H81_08336 [Grifola frondosa]|uniref:Uncharacterized protein n=1 Tax=Grifola frondosa TaxID=5627 RepID=A0A1C7M8E1_GRIFR|nr:hypothetical protein A0H81_08336 [Grifola frondosa]
MTPSAGLGVLFCGFRSPVSWGDGNSVALSPEPLFAADCAPVHPRANITLHTPTEFLTSTYAAKAFRQVLGINEVEEHTLIVRAENVHFLNGRLCKPRLYKGPYRCEGCWGVDDRQLRHTGSGT